MPIASTTKGYLFDNCPVERGGLAWLKKYGESPLAAVRTSLAPASHVILRNLSNNPTSVGIVGGVVALWLQ